MRVATTETLERATSLIVHSCDVSDVWVGTVIGSVVDEQRNRLIESMNGSNIDDINSYVADLSATIKQAEGQL